MSPFMFDTSKLQRSGPGSAAADFLHAAQDTLGDLGMNS